MNWLKKIAQQWGVERLGDMITLALESLDIAKKHPKGIFTPNGWTDTSEDHKWPHIKNRETYSNTNEDLSLAVICYADREWSDSLQVRITLSNGMKQQSQSVYSKRTEVRSLPPKVVATIYKLIDTFFSDDDDDDDDDDDYNEPDFSPEPTPEIGTPVPVGSFK